MRLLVRYFEFGLIMRRRHREDGFEAWGGYMEAKKSKLEDQFKSEAAKSGLQVDNLFKDVAIFVNGYTVPTADELRYLMMKHGGTFHHYYRSELTTHIIASNLPDSKVKQLKAGLVIVKPEWITDSIKESKLLDYKGYLLYTNHSKTQPLLQFKSTIAKSPTKNATDEKFLSEFYNNSRLHLISTLGATFKEYVNELRSKKGTFPGLELLKSLKVSDGEDARGWGDVVMHIDMDCFFVSVGLRDHPNLRGSPVAVTHSKGNRRRDGKSIDSMAEVASCSYEARQAGVKNGMFLGQALKLCPNLNTLPYNFEAYKEVSYQLYNSVARYTLNIEAVSCDELFVDCTELLASCSMPPLEFASIIRNEIKEKTGCPCSTGFGSNRLLARLATHKAKPDGQFFIEPDSVEEFMALVPVTQLPGVGRTTAYKLASMGINTCLDLQNTSVSKLQTDFGFKLGETLHMNSFGKDNKTLTFTKIRKSVSAEMNYGIRFQNDAERDKFLGQLSGEVAKRLEEVRMMGKSITLKIMIKAKDAPEEAAKFLGHGACDYLTKSNSFKSPVDKGSIIFREVLAIMKQLNVPTKDLRGIGIQISKLVPKTETKNLLDKFLSGKSCKGSPIKNQISKEIMQNDTNKESNLSKKEPDNCSESTEKGITQCDLQGAKLENSETSKIDQSFLDAIPEDLRQEVMVQINETETTSDIHENKTDKQEESSSSDEDGLSQQISPLEMRTLLQSWVSSGETPQPCDVDMFSSYLSSLVTSHQLDHLQILLKLFLRELQNKSEIWKEKYYVVQEEVQTTMLSIYGAKLALI